MKILGIETSCDETGAAIVENGEKILANVVASSADMHIKYGGIVPEVAARKQVESMIPVLTEAMNGYSKDDIDAIAVTVGPGLIGSLLVGVETAKTLALTWKKPIIPVNHVLAHIYAVFLKEKNNSQPTTYNLQPVRFPAIALVVSGGHTELYLMSDEKTLRWLGGTLDDAAGECFDKCARLLGLPYPGGPQIAAAAAKPTTHNLQPTTKLPRPMVNDPSLNFSFSGLKTAVLREWKKHSSNIQPTTDNLQLISMFSHEIQESITDVLVAKTLKAASEYNVKSIIVTGGVAANQRLTQKFQSHIQNSQPTLRLRSGQTTSDLHPQPTTYNPQLFIPPPHLCVDSAAYIAAYAFYHNRPVAWKNITAVPSLSVEVDTVQIH